MVKKLQVDIKDYWDASDDVLLKAAAVSAGSVQR